MFTHAKRLLGKALRVVGDHLLSDPTEKPKTNGHKEEPFKATPPRDRAKYNPRDHKTYYIVASKVLRVLLDEGGPMTVRDFTDRSDGIAQSTIRGTCKELVKDGLLTQVENYPASFIIPGEAGDRAREFVAEHLPEENETPPSPASNNPYS